jgi:hypothetical protein
MGGSFLLVADFVEMFLGVFVLQYKLRPDFNVNSALYYIANFPKRFIINGFNHLV